MERVLRERELLPRIDSKNNTYCQSTPLGDRKNDFSLSSYLKKVRLDQLTVRKEQDNKKEQVKRQIESKSKIYKQISRMQIKIVESKDRVSMLCPRDPII